jgi:hypothetical protein
MSSEEERACGIAFAAIALLAALNGPVEWWLLAALSAVAFAMSWAKGR